MTKQKYIYLMLAIFIIFCFLPLSPSFAEKAKKESAITFDIPVIPEVNHHLEWLAHPSYLAIVLENNGLRLNMSNRMVIQSGTSLKIKNVTLNYMGERQGIYLYNMEISLPIESAENFFKTSLEVDTSKLSAGNVQIRIRIPLSEYFPQQFVKEALLLKITRLTNPSIQKKLSGYLDSIDERLASLENKESQFELLMIDFYNLHSTVSSNVSEKNSIDVKPVSDRVLILSTVTILLGMLSFKVVISYFRGKSKG